MPPPTAAVAVAALGTSLSGTLTSQTGDQRRLAQSKLEGQLLLGELEQQRLKDQRLLAVKDKKELQEMYEATRPPLHVGFDPGGECRSRRSRRCYSTFGPQLGGAGPDASSCGVGDGCEVRAGG